MLYPPNCLSTMNSMRFLISGVIIGLGLLPLAAQAQQQPSNTQVAAMVEALRLAAPKTTDDSLYSDMPPCGGTQCYGKLKEKLSEVGQNLV